ncbi:unnamed protein product [Closterium sp. Naga37s-1]|nr:unnamed protein product [Closterium sp. Naga37s-1]
MSQHGHPVTQHGHRAVQGRGRAVGVRAVMEEAAAAAAAAATAARGPSPGPRNLSMGTGRQEGGSRGRGEEAGEGLRGRFVGERSAQQHVAHGGPKRVVQAPSLAASQSHVSRAADIRQPVKATSSLPEFPPGRRDLKRVRSEPEVAAESVVRDLASAPAGKATGVTAGKAAGATAGKVAGVTAGKTGGLFSGPRPLSELLKRKRASDEGGGGDGGVAGSGAQQEKAVGERQRRVARVDVTGGQGEGNVGKTRRLSRVLSGRGGGEEGMKAASTAAKASGTVTEAAGTVAEAGGGEATAAGTGVAGTNSEDAERAAVPGAATTPVSAPAAVAAVEEKGGHATDAKLADDADDGILLVRSGSSQSKEERAVGEVDLGDEELVDEEDEDYDVEGKLGDLW